MFHWSEQLIERREDSGKFVCPECGAETNYDLYRTYRQTSVIVVIPIPIRLKQLYGERLRCTSCRASLPVTVLASKARAVGSIMDAGTEAGCGIESNLGNLIELSETAAREVLSRHFLCKFKGEPVVRITPPLAPDEGYQVGFDYALADGRD
jgi:hypothetical protein